MYKSITIFKYLFFVFLIPVVVSGQIVADRLSGCVPLAQVQLSYPVVVDWDFGDAGGVTAIGKDVVEHSYPVAGSFEVIVYETGTNTELDRTTIEVFSKPAAAFNLTGEGSGCVPLGTSFEDASVGGGGALIMDWKWDFGDGGGSSEQDPSYLYTLVGVFDVSLIVTDANGCDSSIIKEDLISVTDAPTASFTTTPNPASACLGPLTVSFNNNSINSTGGTSDLTHKWDFGNGETSSKVSPAAVTYSTEGTFVVKLEVIEAGGCTVSTTNTVNIGNPRAIPDIPDTVCIGTLINGLGNNSVGATFYVWSFAGGPTYNTKNPAHVFNVAGDQSITLTANSSQGCSDDTSFVIYVEDPQVDFDRNPTYLCDEPYCFNLDGQSAQTNIASWTWDFGDGLGVIGRSEDTSYCYHVNDTLYHVHDPYYYTASVSIVTTNGCVASQNHVDTIYPISAFFVPDSSMGCAPVTVTFSDSTRSREDIVSWQYDFGDGNSSSEQNPVHVFRNPGEYEVVLIAENSVGCKDTSFPVTVLVGEVLPLSFSVSPSAICVGEEVTFEDTSGNPNLDYWHYATNSKKSSSCPGSGTQQWTSFEKVGVQDVTFYGNYNGCISSTTQTNALTVQGPLGSVRYTGVCASPLEYTFIGTIQGATTWDWDFGDGNTQLGSLDSSVTHSYAVSGDYEVSLITHNSTNSCASDTQKMTVNVREVSAVIQGDSTICNSINYSFSGANSVDVYNDCADAYRWDLGEKTIPRTRANSEIPFSFADSGDYTIRLITRDINGCRDTATKIVRVNDIAAKIGADTLQGCLPLTVALSDSSVSDTTITRWFWNFQGALYSLSKDTTITFEQVGQKDIELIAEDELGCRDTTKISIIPLVPDTGFRATSDRTICFGDSVSFKADNEGAIDAVNWTFGSLGTSMDSNPSFVFNQAGSFNVTMSLVDTNGCTGRRVVEDFVEVEDYPVAGFDVRPVEDTLGIICYEEKIFFHDTSYGGAVVSYDWDLQTGQPIIDSDVVSANYTSKGVYEIGLTDTTAFGCQDSVKTNVELTGPFADFDMSKTIICAGESVDFTIKDSSEVQFYVWDFGDGESLNEVSPISHTYYNIPPSLKTDVILLLWGKDSICPQFVIKELNFEEVLADFSFVDDTICMNKDLVVTNTSLGADSQVWSIKQGDQPVQVDASVSPQWGVFTTVGEHQMELVIQNNSIGCIDTLTKDFLIHPIPSVTAKDTAYCDGDEVTLYSSTPDTDLTFLWTSSSDSEIENPDQQVTAASPKQTNNYTITVTDTNQCSVFDVANIFIQQSFPSLNIDSCSADGNKGVVIGESISIGLDKGPAYTYKWEGSQEDKAWLICDDCPTQEIKVTEEVGQINLTLTYTDSLACFDNEVVYNLCILPSYSVDVPTAFTPDGDGINDVVYLRGHGIEKVIMFKIFNRWGELVFESNELSQGWDGVYKGVGQNMETYIYQAEVMFYNGKTEAKEGSVNLIR